jgi:hypothetical protein
MNHIFMYFQNSKWLFQELLKAKAGSAYPFDHISFFV